jgi:hypothetical protein
MKNILPFIAILVVGCASKEVRHPIEWETIYIQGDSITVEMPSDAEPYVDLGEAPFSSKGQVVKYKNYRVKNGDRHFGFVLMRLPKELALNKFRFSAPKLDSRSTLLYRKPITLGQIKGQEFKIDSRNLVGYWSTIIRQFVFGGHFITLLASGPRGSFPDKDYSRFFNSLKIREAGD